MKCIAPIQGYRSAKVNEKTGKRGIVFSVRDGFSHLPVRLPCGRCRACRLERARQWAMRCVHEASLYDHNAFVTLTFAPQHLDAQGSLVKTDFQLFMKRLRKFITEYEFSESTGAYVRRSVKLSSAGVRYFHAGEYGELCKDCGLSRPRCRCRVFNRGVGRPHHHACLFGFDFLDKVKWKEVDGCWLYRSSTLERLWSAGFSTVGEVTFESAAYVARYIMKKMTGEPAAAHYGGRLPEYTTMSRRPGIATAWFEQFKSDVFPADEVVLRGGVKMKPPKFYMKLLEVHDREMYGSVVVERQKQAVDAAQRKPKRTFRIGPGWKVRMERSVESMEAEALELRAAQLTRGRASHEE